MTLDMTGQELLKWGEEQLMRADVMDSAVDSWYLMEYATGCSRADFFLNRDERMPTEQAERYRRLIEERAERVPLQYITGEQEFMGLSFSVSRAVLIPRQDTECLVEEILPYSSGKSVLDLCTGSGCIGICLDRLGKADLIDGVDISDAALAVARKNAKRLRSRIRLWKSDLFSAVTEKYDIIVSNPPYISPAEIDTLMTEVRDFEPRVALDGGGDGLAFYRRIAQESGSYLVPQGKIFLEIGCEQGSDVSKLLEMHGFADVRVIKDLAGRDRIVTGVWPDGYQE